MALFTTEDTVPQSELTARPNLASNKWLKYLGYKDDGSTNTWGKAMGWVNPVGALVANQVSRKLTEGTDGHEDVKDERKQIVNKLLIQAGIAAAVATGGAAAPLLGGAATAGAAAGTGAAAGAATGAATGAVGAGAATGTAVAGIGSQVATKLGGALVDNAMDTVGETISNDATGSKPFTPKKKSAIAQNY